MSEKDGDEEGKKTEQNEGRLMKWRVKEKEGIERDWVEGKE